MAPPTRQQRLLPPAAFAPFLARQKTVVYSDIPPTSRTVNPSHSIKTIAWSPLGNLIATGAGDRTLRIWNPERNQVKNSTELKGHAGGIERVAWNPTREAELASCSADGTIKFWDVRSKNAIGEVKTDHEGLTLAWSPDGEQLVMGTRKDVLIPIARSSLTTLGEYRQPVQTNQTIFSYSGRELILTTGEGQVKILDYPSMSLLYSLNASNSACYCLEMSPTGQHLAVGASDALITLWDTTDFICIRSLAAMTGPVKSLSFSFDGSYIVGGSDEGNILDVASVETGDYVYKFETGNSTSAGNLCVAWAPRSYMLAYSGESPQALRIVGGIGGAS